MIAMFDTANTTAPLSSAVVPGVPGSDIAVGSASIDCAGRLCAAALWVQVDNGTQPSVVMLSADAPAPVFTNVSPGTMDEVAVHQTGPGKYVVAAAGCTTFSVCTDPGGDAWMWNVSL